MKRIYTVLCVIGFSVLSIGLFSNGSKAEAAENHSNARASFGYVTKTVTRPFTETRWVYFPSTPRPSMVFVNKYFVEEKLSGWLKGYLYESHRDSGADWGWVTYTGKVTGNLSGWIGYQ